MHIPKRLILAGAAALLARRALTPRYDMTGKSVLITGGSRGLGLALAREFAGRRARLTLLARSENDLARAAASLRDSLGAEVVTYAGDVTDAEDLEAAVALAVRTYGALDVTVNNAGIIQTGPLQDMTEDDWRGIMEVNAFAPLRLTQAAYPHLKAARGRVVVVASVGGKVAVPHLGPYSMSKFAAAGLGAALHAELARDGIRVTTVLPGLMQTGSPKNAIMKGNHEAEYAWFATLDNLPLVSLPAAEAARLIVDATERGDAEAMIGLPATVLRYAQALAPQLTADLMRLTNAMLPGPTGQTVSKLGSESESDLTRRNALKRAAEREFNQD